MPTSVRDHQDNPVTSPAGTSMTMSQPSSSNLPSPSSQETPRPPSSASPTQSPFSSGVPAASCITSPAPLTTSQEDTSRRLRPRRARRGAEYAQRPKGIDSSLALRATENQQRFDAATSDPGADDAATADASVLAASTTAKSTTPATLSPPTTTTRQIADLLTYFGNASAPPLAERGADNMNVLLEAAASTLQNVG